MPGQGRSLSLVRTCLTTISLPKRRINSGISRPWGQWTASTPYRFASSCTFPLASPPPSQAFPFQHQTFDSTSFVSTTLDRCTMTRSSVSYTMGGALVVKSGRREYVPAEVTLKTSVEMATDAGASGGGACCSRESTKS